VQGICYSNGYYYVIPQDEEIDDGAMSENQSEGPMKMYRDVVLPLRDLKLDMVEKCCLLAITLFGASTSESGAFKSVMLCLLMKGVQKWN